MHKIEGNKLKTYPFSPFDFDTNLDFTPGFDSIVVSNHHFSIHRLEADLYLLELLPTGDIITSFGRKPISYQLHCVLAVSCDLRI